MEFNIFATKENNHLHINIDGTQGSIIDFFIRNMPDAQIVSAKGGNSINIRNNDLKIVVFKHEESVVLQFMNKTATPEGYVLQFEDVIKPINSNTFNISGEHSVFVMCERSTCVANENQLSIYPSGSHSIITFYVPKDSFSALMSEMALNFTASSDVYNVTVNSAMPEFSIAVFDDAGRTTPRPMRLGIPVISTVPVYRAGLSESELQILEIGSGTEKRTMYFKIISNIVIPDEIEPVLHIYLPAGLDTVAEPVAVEMTRQVSLDSTRSVFYASYAFHKEDTINYVDGFAYLSVYMPMEISAELAVSIEVTPTGDAISDPYEDNPVLG